MEAEVTEIKPKTLVWTVRNTNYGYVLGTIKWFWRWRQYCFFPSLDVIFSANCLQEIINFIKTLRQKAKPQVLGEMF
jgi:hypothetical protein